MAQHIVFILFLFALGACIGSFLNVVVWRWPRGESLISPPSRCPKCEKKLSWRDNIPVLGWIILQGKCRYCGNAISARYPIIEAVTGLVFVFYYVMFFMFNIGPCAPEPIVGTGFFGEPVRELRMVGDLARDWPIYALYMFMLSALLAASLIDAELQVIPLDIPWLVAGVAFLAHALSNHPTLPGALNLTDPTGVSAGLAVGGAAGLLISILLHWRGIIPMSFPEGEGALEIDQAAWEQEVAEAKKAGREPPPPPRIYTRAEIRREISKEMLFLLPPLVGAMAAGMAMLLSESLQAWWAGLMHWHWLTGLLGSVLGALVGALVVWLARILGTLGFGRIAMGLGDVHLMFGIGAVVGAGAAVVTFFLAPFAGLAVGLYALLTRSRHELPYGPYLSLAAAAVLLFYCPIAEFMRPGLEGVAQLLLGQL